MVTALPKYFFIILLKVEKVQPKETTRGETQDGLPAPKTSVRLQIKYTKAIPLETGKVAYHSSLTETKTAH